MAKKEYSFYQGCSSERKASASNYMTSVMSMCKTLDVKLNEIPDWNCCAASIGYAEGGELPRRIGLTIDGEAREQSFPPWADPVTRRVELPGAVAGSKVEVSAEGFAPAEGVVEEESLEARVELGRSPPSR